MADQIMSYDDKASIAAEKVGWEYYSKIYAKYIMASGRKLNFVQPDATQTTKMVLWHYTMLRAVDYG